MMRYTEILTRQTENTYDWVNKLLDSIPKDKWDITPEIIESNVVWQVGHLVMSFYYHSVMVIAGHQTDIMRYVPLREYDLLFTDSPAANVIGKVNLDELQNQLLLVQKKSIDIIRSLAEKDLENELEPTSIPHPVASTKCEALEWNIKHAMWHCGQLGILKRIVDKRFDFGLKKPGQI